MIKRMTLLAGRADLSNEAFSSHWLNNHGEIVKRMPAVAGYIQNLIVKRTMREQNAADPFSFDGVVELWFEDAAAQATAFASDAAKLLPVDEPNFIRGITIYPVEEHLISRQTFAIKALLAVRTAARADDGATESKTVSAVAAALPQEIVVVVNQLGKAGWRENLWHEPNPPDLIVELGFRDVSALEDFISSRELGGLHRSVAATGGAIECYLVEPRRVI
jgi:uncharacterized protein (TIGR02118 family)